MTMSKIHAKKQVKTQTNAQAKQLPANQLHLVSAWLEQLLQQNYSHHTLSAYHSAVMNLLIFLHKRQRQFNQCDKRLLTYFISERREQHQIQAKSMQRELSAIRHFYTWLIANGHCLVNPTTGYQIKGQARTLPNIADIDLLTQLLDQPMPEDAQQARLWIRDKAMFELLYGSGLRVGELVALDVNDIDLTQKMVSVFGKGQKRRFVPMTNSSVDAINRYLPHRYLWVEEADMALFISEQRGIRLSTRTVQQRLKICAYRAGIDQNLYPHLLRHCFASHMLSESGDLRAVQEMLGHADVSTTQIYTQVDFVKLTQIYDVAHPRATRKGVSEPK